MADLVTRLRLDDKQFNEKITRCKEQLDGISVTGQKAGRTFEDFGGSIGNVVSKFGPLAAAVGLATGAGGAFNKMMENSQAFGDKMTVAINAAKDSVNEFFYALGTGDFSSFINGLRDIIDKSKNVTEALDQLGNTRMSYSFVRGESRRKIADAKIIAKNKDLSKEEREAGYNAWMEGMKEAKENASVLEGEILNTIKTIAIQNTPLNDDLISVEDIKAVARLDVMNPLERTKEKERLSAMYEEFLKKDKEITGKRGTWVSGGKQVTWQEKRSENVEKYKDAILYNNLLNRKGDPRLQESIDLLKEAAAANEELGAWQEELNNDFKAFNTELKKTVSVSSELKNESPAGSIAEIEGQINDKTKQLKMEVDPQSRIQIYEDIQKLTEQKRIIEFKYKFSKDPGAVSKKGGSLADLANKDGLTGKIDNLFNEDGVELNNDYAASLGNIASAMGSISTMTKEGAGAWLTWGANLLSAVTSAIPAITALIGVKKTEAVVNGVKSASETPITGWLMAAAGGAAVLAALAAIPAFANGGIIPGVLTTGDKNIARVNAGEMILNRGQQANLFNLLDKGGPLGSGGKVEFKIQGSQLVGVIKNYNNQINKLR